MATRGWRPYWTTPGLTETPRPVLDQTINRDLTVKRNLKVGGTFTQQLNWIPYTPSVALVILVGFGSTLAISANTIVGRYRKSSGHIIFEVSGNVTFNAGSGQGFLQVGLPSILPTAPFTVNGSFMGTTPLSTTSFPVSLTGYGAIGATTVILANSGVIDQGPSGALAYGLNYYAPTTGRTITIIASGQYEYPPP